MPAIAIIGGQWGDEGKGKVVDYLAQRAHTVARFGGGSNAGHTVINQYGEFRMHLVPSGVFYPHVICLIGNGVVVDPKVLLEEIDLLRGRGVDTSRLFLSDRAHLVMPYHFLLDGLEEEARGAGALGTTRRGIGPCYVDKAARLGIRAGELLDREAFRKRLAFVLEQKNALITRVYGREPLSLEGVFNEYCAYGERLRPFIRDTGLLLDAALERGEWVVLEGAQGALLDLDFGTYPYVTSSSPTIGGALTGLGVSARRLEHVLGVFKAYSTRVGEGPMPTEMEKEMGQRVRERGHEYGATTGRPRRCGWFDGVAARYASRLNGFTGLAITRLDVLDELPALKLCGAYKVGHETLEHFPASLPLLERCQPAYEELPGWQTPLRNIRRFEDLPPRARAYIKKIEEIASCPVVLVSVGPQREETILIRPLF